MQRAHQCSWLSQPAHTPSSSTTGFLVWKPARCATRHRSQPAIFLLGALIAIHYGGARRSAAEELRASLRYFRSPIVLEFATDFMLSIFVGPVSNPIYEELIDALKVADQDNTFLVTLTVSLLLRLSGPGKVARAAALGAGARLLIMPLLAWLPASAFGPAAWQLEVLLLEAGMPSAMLAVALCSSYGCDDRLAAALVIATSAISMLTLPAFIALLR